MPSLPSQNEFSVLKVYSCNNNDTPSAIDVRGPSETPLIVTKYVRHPAWERRLPRKYKISAIPGENSLAVDIELESTDSGVKCCTSSLINCGATGYS
jgi:hypothetical protein